MANLISTFQERFGDWVAALGQHLQLSLLTLLVAIFLTIPLAIYLNSHKKAANWVLQIAGIFSNHSFNGLAGTFYPPHGDWHTAGTDCSGDLRYFPDFRKYCHGFEWD